MTASIETQSSHSDVPTNYDKTNKNSDTFNFLPIAIELEINISAPLLKRKDLLSRILC